MVPGRRIARRATIWPCRAAAAPSVESARRAKRARPHDGRRKASARLSPWRVRSRTEDDDANWNRRKLPFESTGIRPVRPAVGRGACAADDRHQFTGLRRSAFGGEGRSARAFDRVVVPVAEAPSRAASAQGRRRLVDMLAMGKAVARPALT